MITKTIKSYSRPIAWLIYAGLALRVIIPAGYMPAALADGLPFVLCPDGIFSARTFSVGSDAVSHHQHSGQDGDAVGSNATVNAQTCPFGSAFGAAVPLADLDFQTFFFTQVLAQDNYAGPSRPVVRQSYSARAPPQRTGSA